jgi:hypothetical protein
MCSSCKPINMPLVVPFALHLTVASAMNVAGHESMTLSLHHMGLNYSTHIMFMYHPVVAIDCDAAAVAAVRCGMRFQFSRVHLFVPTCSIKTNLGSDYKIHQNVALFLQCQCMARFASGYAVHPSGPAAGASNSSPRWVHHALRGYEVTFCRDSDRMP